MRNILKRSANEKLPSTGPTRFPVRVDLPLYADALKSAMDNSEDLTLLSFMASHLSRNIDLSIKADDLREWLRRCPSIIILDGLDEVPPSSNRLPVIAAIDSLFDDLYSVSADVLVVVTTRPQGYSEDLDPHYWQHWNLRPLETEEAIRFAERLSAVRLSDPDRRDAVLSELRRAATDQTTATLLSSPLQVTILFGIALLKGTIPQSRWDLFERYYTLIRDREAMKPAQSATIIREHRATIDKLHHEAGFLLQLKSESAGGAKAPPFELTEVLIHGGGGANSFDGADFRKAAPANDVALGGAFGGFGP